MDVRQRGEPVAMQIERAVEAHELVPALRRFGLSQVDVAVAVGVSDRAVRNWKRQGGISRVHQRRLEDLRAIVLELQDSLTPRGVGQWLHARNRLLDGRRPIEMLAEGKAAAVLGAARAFADGAYV